MWYFIIISGKRGSGYTCGWQRGEADGTKERGTRKWKTYMRLWIKCWWWNRNCRRWKPWRQLWKKDAGQKKVRRWRHVICNWNISFGCHKTPEEQYSQPGWIFGRTKKGLKISSIFHIMICTPSRGQRKNIKFFRPAAKRCWPLFMQQGTTCVFPLVSARLSYAALVWCCNNGCSTQSFARVPVCWWSACRNSVPASKCPRILP